MKIHTSTDYDSFQFYKQNRKISPDHVKKLMADPTFPEGFKTAAIVVDKNKFVIEGQHRLLAAKGLGIPVYFMVDEMGDKNSIKSRNANMRPWDRTEFINFYAKDDNATYIFIQEILAEHKIGFDVLSTILYRFLSNRYPNITHSLKEGQIKLSEAERKDLTEICGLVFPKLKELRKCRNKDDIASLKTRTYLDCYAMLFKKDKSKLEKFFKKIFLCPENYFPHIHIQERCFEQIDKIVKFKPSK